DKTILLAVSPLKCMPIDPYTAGMLMCLDKKTPGMQGIHPGTSGGWDPSVRRRKNKIKVIDNPGQWFDCDQFPADNK
ncbi:MAG TPA: hypothetical protein VFW37_01100, partial [Alphaproteobacteria bacterium]|nr:hypothetical protein [Alphaproteobacteria bacterium]